MITMGQKRAGVRDMKANRLTIATNANKNICGSERTKFGSLCIFASVVVSHGQL